MLKASLTLAVLLTPPILVGFAYDVFLHHRSDYLGHFLAGFGGALGALTIALWTIPNTKFASRVGWVTLGVVVGCIALGAIFEETLYHIAKWDEIDFCNQSLGAVLAGLTALAVAEPLRRNPNWGAFSACWGGLVLLGGYYFAFR